MMISWPPPQTQCDSPLKNPAYASEYLTPFENKVARAINVTCEQNRRGRLGVVVQIASSLALLGKVCI